MVLIAGLAVVLLRLWLEESPLSGPPLPGVIILILLQWLITMLVVNFEFNHRPCLMGEKSLPQENIYHLLRIITI